MRSGDLTKSLSSVPLQVLLFFHGVWIRIYLFAELLIFIYKGNVLPYPTKNCVAEVFLLFLLFFVEIFHVSFTSKGNLTERKVPLTIGFIFSIPIFICYFFYYYWQTYVLRVEQVLNIIGMGMVTAESVLSLLSIFALIRNSPFE